MKLKKLLKKLNKIRNKHGNLPVFVYADHGQDCSTCYSVSVQNLDTNNEMIHDDDIGDYSPHEFKKSIVISD